MGCSSSTGGSVAVEPNSSNLGKADSEQEAVNFKPIHSAVRWNKSIDEIENLLVSTAAVNAVDESNGNYPIHIAAQNGHNDIVQLLIRKNANINAKNLKGNTAIHMAIGYDYYSTAMILISEGADQSIANDDGFPGSRGIEGDKSLGLAALACAKTEEELSAAFDLCEKSIQELTKPSFVAAGLKTKRAIGANWTPTEAERFKQICGRL